MTWMRTSEGCYAALIHGVQYRATRTHQGLWRVQTVTENRPLVTGEFTDLGKAKAHVEHFAELELWERESGEFTEGWMHAHAWPPQRPRADASSWWMRGFDAARQAIEDGDADPDRRTAHDAYLTAKFRNTNDNPENAQ